MIPLFPIQWQSQMFSTTIFLQLIANNFKKFHFLINISKIFLKNRPNVSFFLSPNGKTEIENFISSLDSNKSAGPNSIPTNILKLLKNDISSYLSETFNISFSSGVFPSILKTVTVTPVHEKNSKLDFSNYHPILLLSNTEKTLEILLYNRIYKFFSKNNLIYSLQFSFKQK